MTSDDELPEIPVVCDDCETRTSVPFAEVEDAVTRHNDQLHDGEPGAQVDPEVLDQLNDLVAKDMGLLD